MNILFFIKIDKNESYRHKLINYEFHNKTEKKAVKYININIIHWNYFSNI